MTAKECLQAAVTVKTNRSTRFAKSETWNLVCVGGPNDGKTVFNLHGDVHIYGYTKTGERIGDCVVYRPLAEAGMSHDEA